MKVGTAWVDITPSKPVPLLGQMHVRLGAYQRDTTSTPACITLMGLRLYNRTTGRFLTTDPIPGGNDNAYVYPADPINGNDVSGALHWWQKAAVKLALKGLQVIAGLVCGKLGLPWSAVCAILAGGAAGVVSFYINHGYSAHATNKWGWIRAFISGAGMALASAYAKYLPGFIFRNRVAWAIVQKLKSVPGLTGPVDWVIEWAANV